MKVGNTTGIVPENSPREDGSHWAAYPLYALFARYKRLPDPLRQSLTILSPRRFSREVSTYEEDSDIVAEHYIRRTCGFILATRHYSQLLRQGHVEGTTSEISVKSNLGRAGEAAG